jgi:hypothetical protein
VAATKRPRKYNIEVAGRLVLKLGEIESITEYLWAKELEDFGEQLREDNADNHVFRDLVAVDNAIYDTSNTPESYLPDEVA